MPKGVYFCTGIMPNQDTHVVMDLYVVGNPDYWFGILDEATLAAIAQGNAAIG